LAEWLTASGKKQSLAAVEHARIEETPEGVRFAAPREFGLTLKSPDMAKAVAAVLGRPAKVVVEVSDTDAPPAAPAAVRAADDQESELRARVLGNPEVQRFQELFPGSKIKNFEDLSNV
jgi:hypothetical protein